MRVGRPSISAHGSAGSSELQVDRMYRINRIDGIKETAGSVRWTEIQRMGCVITWIDVPSRD
jgi:hypothetical protein